MSERMVMVGYDFSPAAERALAWAAEYQRACHDVRLSVVHSISPYPVDIAPTAAIQPLFTGEDRERLLTELKAAVGHAGITGACECDVLLAPEPGWSLIDAAKERSASLVVLGTHGRTGFKRLVMGSVAEQVVRNAPCPVLTIRDPS